MVRDPRCPQSCLIPPYWENKLFSSFCGKKKKGVGGAGGRKGFQSRENYPLIILLCPLIFVSWTLWFLLVKLPFCVRKGLGKDNMLKLLFFPFPQRKAYIGPWSQCFFVVLPSILYLSKETLGILGFEICFPDNIYIYNIYVIYVSQNTQGIQLLNPSLWLSLPPGL